MACKDIVLTLPLIGVNSEGEELYLCAETHLYYQQRRTSRASISYMTLFMTGNRTKYMCLLRLASDCHLWQDERDLHHLCMLAWDYINVKHIHSIPRNCN